MDLLKSIKKKQSLSRGAKSPAERVMLFFAYITSECVVLPHSVLHKDSRQTVHGGEVASDILNSEYSSVGILR